ncbi:unnamed protein product [Caretta caretta]
MKPCDRDHEYVRVEGHLLLLRNGPGVPPHHFSHTIPFNGMLMGGSKRSGQVWKMNSYTWFKPYTAFLLPSVPLFPEGAQHTNKGRRNQCSDASVPLEDVPGSYMAGATGPLAVPFCCVTWPYGQVTFGLTSFGVNNDFPPLVPRSHTRSKALVRLKSPFGPLCPGSSH